MFWLGLSRKIKDVFTKSEADKLYIKKDEKNNLVQTSGDQTINGNKTFTGTTGFGRVSTLGSTSNGDAFFLPKKDSGKSILYTGNSAFNNDKRFDIDLQDRTKLLNVPNPTADKDAANKFYVDTNFVPNSQKSNFVQVSGNQTINGNKSFNGIIRFADKIEAGFGSGIVNFTPEDNSNKIIKFSGVDGRGKFDLDLNNTSKILNVPSPVNSGDAVNKQYIDSKLPSLENRVSLLESYSKTGILQFQIIDYLQGKIRIKWLQKPLGWNDNNILLNRLHISIQIYTASAVILSGFTNATNYQEFNNISLNPVKDIITNQVENATYKNLDNAITFYLWFDWNTQYIESDIPNKIQLPVGFKFEKNGYSWYVPVKIK